MSLFHTGKRSFSLVEVVIAVGVFAVAVCAMLGLLPALARQSSISDDTLAAAGLTNAVQTELERIVAIGGLDALASQTGPLAMPLPETCLLAATRDGSRLHSLNYLPPASPDVIAEDLQYFLIEAWSFAELPLAFESNSTVLMLHVRVCWPYHIPFSLTATPAADRAQITFNLILHR